MRNSQNNTAAPKQQRRTGVLLLVILGLCLLAGAFVAITVFFPKNSPQPEIQALLEKRAMALNEKNLERYLNCFSSEYRDGGQGYAELKENASRWFIQFESIHFSFQTLHLEIDDARALVESNYKFSLRPPDGDLLNISNKELLELRHEQSGWKIFRNIKPQ
jgi:Na+-transporting NADH:ubiquinone oxidoreductase subunit NqrC